MARINCVPPEELCDKHLKGEYYEIPRVVRIVRNLIAKGHDPVTWVQDWEYSVGKGNVSFFYDKCGFLAERMADLLIELVSRKVVPQLVDLPGLFHGLPKKVMNNWVPEERDLALNREDLKEKVAILEATKRARRPLMSHRE